MASTASVKSGRAPSSTAATAGSSVVGRPTSFTGQQSVQSGPQRSSVASASGNSANTNFLNMRDSTASGTSNPTNYQTTMSSHGSVPGTLSTNPATVGSSVGRDSGFSGQSSFQSGPQPSPGNSSFQAGVPSQDGNSSFQAGMPSSVHDGNSSFEAGAPSHDGNSSFEAGAPSAQGGAPAAQGGQQGGQAANIQVQAITARIAQGTNNRVNGFAATIRILSELARREQTFMGGQRFAWRFVHLAQATEAGGDGSSAALSAAGEPAQNLALVAAHGILGGGGADIAAHLERAEQDSRLDARDEWGYHSPINRNFTLKPALNSCLWVVEQSNVYLCDRNDRIPRHSLRSSPALETRPTSTFGYPITKPMKTRKPTARKLSSGRVRPATSSTTSTAGSRVFWCTTATTSSRRYH